jgi:hypothetical protein
MAKLLTLVMFLIIFTTVLNVMFPDTYARFGDIFSTDTVAGSQAEALRWAFLLGVGASIISAGVIGANFGSIYFIPAAVALNLINILWTPINSLGGVGLPEPFGWLLVVILNVMLVMAILEFIRGGSM